jgi:2-polyprenyl-3-methyl-5-hydroxy-6-metoxy-1,4-benzoquinol methylase
MMTNPIEGARERILPTLELLSSTNGWQERSDLLSQFVRQRYRGHADPIQILEAGCGRSWPLDLGEVRFELTGVDLDGKALAARQTEMRDLHHAVVGDLLTVEFPPERFDVIYCCEVLEHIERAEEVMRRFVTWLKPDGVALLAFPDPKTVFGLATRLSPHWMHVAYHRYVLRIAEAGRPGYGPYRAYYNKLISRRGMHDFCARHGLKIALERGRPPANESWPRWFRRLYATAAPIVAQFSGQIIASDHMGLIYAVEKDILTAVTERAGAPSGLAAETR